MRCHTWNNDVKKHKIFETTCIVKQQHNCVPCKDGNLVHARCVPGQQSSNMSDNAKVHLSLPLPYCNTHPAVELFVTCCMASCSCVQSCNCVQSCSCVRSCNCVLCLQRCVQPARMCQPAMCPNVLNVGCVSLPRCVQPAMCPHVCAQLLNPV